MNTIIISVVVAVLGILAGYVAGTALKKGKGDKEQREAVEAARRLVEQAEKDVEARRKEVELEVKDQIIEAKNEMEKELKERRAEIAKLERRFLQKEENLDRKMEQLEKKDQDLNRRDQEFRNREGSLDEKMRAIETELENQRTQLERIASYSKEEARREIIRRVEEESRFDAARIAKRIEEEATENAQKASQKVLGLAVQRYASDYVADATVSVVNLPSDEMKGRIIGREGRNIRALEAATGVDVIVDDTPESVVLSAFDPVRRQVARAALEKLISDGRIHPARIEEVVEKARREIEATIKEEGEKAVFDLGLHGVHPEIIKLVGRLKYRTSYAQNVLQHSREVAYLAGMMADEIGIDGKMARRAGLLHDIGKGVDHEYEGTHMSIGVELAKKYGENPYVLNAIESHHGDVEASCVESALVAAADALSAARPGARRESLENYMKRLEKLEELATSFKGVEKCYAIQAGREIRVLVKPEDTSEEACYIISRDLARRIEEEMAYPGQIKVTVIRESRFVEYAK